MDTAYTILRFVKKKMFGSYLRLSTMLSTLLITLAKLDYDQYCGDYSGDEVGYRK